MTHIHLPDGVLPAWLWVSGWAVALVLVFAAGHPPVGPDMAPDGNGRRIPI